MALKLQITPPHGQPTVDITGFMTHEQWTVQEQYGRQGSTAMIYLEAPLGFNSGGEGGHPYETQLTLLVKPFAILELSDTSLGAILFEGVVSDPYIDLTNQPTLAKYVLQCRDYTYYADSRLVSGTYTNRSAGYIINDLTANASPTCGLTVDPNIPDGPIISNIQFDHLQLTDAWDQVSQLSSWQSDYAWWVGYDQLVHWGNEGDCHISGLTITDNVTGPADSTKAYIETGQTFRYEWDGTTLRNNVVVRGATKQGTRTDTWLGDGTTTQWSISYDLDATASTVTLTVGGVSKSTEVVSKPENTTKDFALIQQPSGQWILAKGAGAIPGAGAAIVLGYTYNYPILATATLGTSIAQYDGPNDGYYDMYLSDSTLTNATMAYARAQAELQQYALCQERLTCTISADWGGHIRTGEACKVNLSSVPDSRSDPGWQLGINDWFVVIQNQIRGLPGGYREYDLVLVRFSEGT